MSTKVSPLEHVKQKMTNNSNHNQGVEGLLLVYETNGQTEWLYLAYRVPSISAICAIWEEEVEKFPVPIRVSLENGSVLRQKNGIYFHGSSIVKSEILIGDFARLFKAYSVLIPERGLFPYGSYGSRDRKPVSVGAECFVDHNGRRMRITESGAIISQKLDFGSIRAKKKGATVQRTQAKIDRQINQISDRIGNFLGKQIKKERNNRFAQMRIAKRDGV